MVVGGYPGGGDWFDSPQVRSVLNVTSYVRPVHELALHRELI